MNKQFIWITALLVLVLFSMNASDASAATQVFRGNVYSGDSVDIDDDMQVIITQAFFTSIYAKVGNQADNVPMGTCEDDIYNLIICYESYDYDEDEDKFFFTINISRKEPIITVERDIDYNAFFVGEEGTISVTITNTGDPTSDVTYVDEFPSTIEITETDGVCKKQGNSIVWSGHLNPDETKECEYKIEGTAETHAYLSAKLTYFDGFNIEEEYVSPFWIDFYPVLGVQTQIIKEYDVDEDYADLDFEDDNEDIQIGEKARLIVNISNDKYDNEMTVRSFKIYIPSGLDYLGPATIRATQDGKNTAMYFTQMTQKDDYLEWSGDLNNNETALRSKRFALEFRPKRSGTYNFIIEADYETESASGLSFENYVDQHFDKMSVTDKGVKMRVYLQDEDKRYSHRRELVDDEAEEIEAMNKERIRVSLQNLNAYASIKDITMNLLTNLTPLENIRIDRMNKSQGYTTHSIVFNVPQVDKETTMKLNITTEYTTEYGEHNINSSEFEFKIKPYKEVEITHEIGETTIEEGEETTITTKVTNNRLVELFGLEVKDIVPAELNAEGVTGQTIVLQKDTDVDVYTYKITAPDVDTRKYFVINTTAKYFDKDYGEERFTSETAIITVEPRKPDISFERTLEEDEVAQGEIFDISYTVTNDEDKFALKNLKIYFPIQEEFDLVGTTSYFIEKLDPGETIEIWNTHRARAKIAQDSLEMIESEVWFEDDYGNEFYEYTGTDTIDVNKGNMFGPVILAQLIAPAKANQTAEFLSILKIANLGDVTSEISLEEDSNVKTDTIKKQSTKQMKTTRKYSDIGTETIYSPIITYNYHNLLFTTTANPASVDIVEYIPIFEAVPTTAAGIIGGLQEEIEQIEEGEVEEEFEEVPMETPMRVYVGYGIIIGLVIIAIVIYIFFRRGGKEEFPFLERED